MVSAISRILSIEGPWAVVWNRLFRWRGRRRLNRVEDLPEDLLADIGFEDKQRPFTPRADIGYRQGGLGDYLRPGPM